MNKVKYSSFTPDFKLKVTEYAEKHGNRAISHEFTMSDFNVRYWMNQKDVTNKSRKAFQGEKS
jgi:transposase-like protein